MFGAERQTSRPMRPRNFASGRPVLIGVQVLPPSVDLCTPLPA